MKWCHTAATMLSAASSDKGRRSNFLQVVRLGPVLGSRHDGERLCTL